MHSAKKVLIVDDDSVLRERLSKAFQRRGYFCSEAASVQAGEKEAIGFEPDWVILDLKMPGEFGTELIPKLLEIRKEIKVIILTAYGSVSTAVSSIKLGAIDYLIKPVTVDEIIKVFSGDNLERKESEKEMSLAQREWEHLQKVLLENKGNISKAAKSLGIHRRTLQRKLEKKVN